MARTLHVLLVEDDDPLRIVLAELLGRRGWAVHATGRGDRAIELARSIRIDFSIIDLHLPGMSGVEVFRSLSPLPSILMSGAASSSEARRALELGMFTFLSKPLDFDAFRTTVDELIRAHFGPGALRPPTPPTLPGGPPSA